MPPVPNIEQHIETTEMVLKEIHADKVPRILVLNKVDRVVEGMDRMILKKTYPDSIAVSALDMEKVELLREYIQEYFSRNFVRNCTILPYSKTELLSRFYQLGMVEQLGIYRGRHSYHPCSDTCQQEHPGRSPQGIMFPGCYRSIRSETTD